MKLESNEDDNANQNATHQQVVDVQATVPTVVPDNVQKPDPPIKWKPLSSFAPLPTSEPPFVASPPPSPLSPSLLALYRPTPAAVSTTVEQDTVVEEEVDGQEVDGQEVEERAAVMSEAELPQATESHTSGQVSDDHWFRHLGQAAYESELGRLLYGEEQERAWQERAYASDEILSLNAEQEEPEQAASVRGSDDTMSLDAWEEEQRRGDGVDTVQG